MSCPRHGVCHFATHVARLVSCAARSRGRDDADIARTQASPGSAECQSARDTDVVSHLPLLRVGVPDIQHARRGLAERGARVALDRVPPRVPLLPFRVAKRREARGFETGRSPRDGDARRRLRRGETVAGAFGRSGRRERVVLDRRLRGVARGVVARARRRPRVRVRGEGHEIDIRAGDRGA